MEAYLRYIIFLRGNQLEIFTNDIYFAYNMNFRYLTSHVLISLRICSLYCRRGFRQVYLIKGANFDDVCIVEHFDLVDISPTLLCLLSAVIGSNLKRSDKLFIKSISGVTKIEKNRLFFEFNGTAHLTAERTPLPNPYYPVVEFSMVIFLKGGI